MTDATRGTSPSGRSLADLVALAALSAAWWSAAVLVDPHGDFPLNDDWGYAVPVRALVDEGTLRFADWQSMPLLTQALWGAAFCALFGVSFTAMRVSTLVLGWLGLLATYALLRTLRAPVRWAALGACALALSPIYFALAFSFMTDVPFVALMIAASAAWVHAVRTDRASWRVVATMLAVIATLDRQIGIALPLAWAVGDALRLGLGRRWAASALVPLVIVVGALVAFQKIVDATIGLPAFYHTKSVELMQALGGLVRLRGLRYPLERTSLSLVYLGLWSLPIVLGAAAAIARRRWVIASTLGALVVGLALGAIGVAMPLTGNVWIETGIGPYTLDGDAPRAPHVVWIAITGIGVAAAWLMLVVLGRALRARLGWHEATPTIRARAKRAWSALREGEMPIWIALFLTALIGYAPTAVVYGPFFDRYLLGQLPFVLALLALEIVPTPSDRRVLALGSVFVVASALFSIAATHDYLAWQRARWALVERAAERSIARTSIDGGFEVNNHPAPEGPPVENEDAPYRLAMSPMEAHEVVEERAVDAWMPWSVRRVYLLRAL
ncbi:glycosyltransferase family 39 protein [Sandaracinus amylolyticus]|uniref:Glycosyltransferase RgtA/B/C/D-like domain-containing protein n=1 Tax=Sandaracinus amylolyticus TaxID=927083 RepID=A0A0F6VZ24_9BACT|nr:glycosyltransferase family 39 protein [Sandaracinus amylolyticus]AKF03096.1 hypothetical protein DB32_000245 [Sandaracinus amylolyticus]